MACLKVVRLLHGKSHRLTDATEYEGPHNHEHSLDKVSPDDSRESSRDGEETGNAEQDDDGDVDGSVALDLGGLGDEQGAGKQVSLKTVFLSDQNF